MLVGILDCDPELGLRGKREDCQYRTGEGQRLVNDGLNQIQAVDKQIEPNVADGSKCGSWGWCLPTKWERQEKYGRAIGSECIPTVI